MKTSIEFSGFLIFLLTAQFVLQASVAQSQVQMAPVSSKIERVLVNNKTQRRNQEC